MAGRNSDEIIGGRPVFFLIEKQVLVTGINGGYRRDAKVIGVDVISPFLIQIGQTENVGFHGWFDGAIECGDELADRSDLG